MAGRGRFGDAGGIGGPDAVAEGVVDAWGRRRGGVHGFEGAGVGGGGDYAH